MKKTRTINIPGDPKFTCVFRTRTNFRTRISKTFIRHKINRVSQISCQSALSQVDRSVFLIRTRKVSESKATNRDVLNQYGKQQILRISLKTRDNSKILCNFFLQIVNAHISKSTDMFWNKRAVLEQYNVLLWLSHFSDTDVN